MSGPLLSRAANSGQEHPMAPNNYIEARQNWLKPD